MVFAMSLLLDYNAVPLKRATALTWMAVGLLFLAGSAMASPVEMEPTSVKKAPTNTHPSRGPPVCQNQDGLDPQVAEACAAEAAAAASSSACSLYIYGDGWIVAGRPFQRGEEVGRRDVMIKFTQHSRRAFPKWKRHHYFWHDVAGGNSPFDFVFAPDLQAHVDCHERFDNLELASPVVLANMSNEVTWVNPPMIASRVLAVGDPVFLPCRDKELATVETYDQFIQPTLEELLESGTCLDGLAMRPSTIPGAGQGAFTTRAYSYGQVVASGLMLHMHRSELRNPTTGQDELLLNYCFGHEQSNLLLLPLIPLVSNINHDKQRANVRLLWRNNQVPSLFELGEHTEKLFEETEKSELEVDYIALRDLQPGEELFMDYGAAWERAYQPYQAPNPAGDSVTGSFRHEIGVPPGFFPESWLTIEAQSKDRPVLLWDARKLQPLEIGQLQLTTGEYASAGLHRIGLPPHFADYMEKWADDMGITKIMESYIIGEKTLGIDATEHQRVNGGTWWVKRFWGEWKANMHYITPDDDEANRQFLEALGKAGFGEVLASIGQEFKLKSLTCYYPSFIAVSHATYSSMHSDSDFNGVYNLIFPVKQIDGFDPEINLANDKLDYHVPYRYERDHACLLGVNGQHGTAPCNYRGTGKIRMVISVYMGDFTNQTNLDGVVDEWLTSDPPYPRNEDVRATFIRNQHWSRTDPTKSLFNSVVTSTIT